MSLAATLRKWYDSVRSPPAGGSALGPRALRYLLGILCFRIVLAAVVPITGDEAYFVEWARHLDWCYYDHPGMVAWIMKPFLVLFGDSLLSVRAQAILSGIVFCVVAHRLATRLYPGTRVAERSLLLAGLVPIAAVGSVLVSTDTPLVVFWALALLAFHEATERGRMRDWALTGVLVGGAFLSKFLAFGFLPAAFLYLVIPKENRRHLRTPGPWIAVAICAALFLPVILWNYGHDWATFKFNFVHRQQGLSFSPGTFAQYLALQMLVFSPVVLVVCVFHAFKGLRRHLENRNDLFLVLFAGVPIGGFACLSFFRTIGGHWTAMALVPLVVYFARVTDREGRGRVASGSAGEVARRGRVASGSAGEATRRGGENPPAGGKSRMYAVGLATAGGLSLAVVVLVMLVLSAGPQRLSRTLVAFGASEHKARKAVADVYALPAVAAKAEDPGFIEGLDEDAPARRSATVREGAFFASDSYALASLLTYHSPTGSHYHVWGPTGVHGGNHELWDDFASLAGRTMIFVVRMRGPGERYVRRMLPHFESLVVHRFDREPAGDDGAESAGFATGKVEVVAHDAPFEFGPFIIIEGKGFSGENVD